MMRVLPPMTPRLPLRQFESASLRQQSTRRLAATFSQRSLFVLFGILLFQFERKLPEDGGRRQAR
jgi:hypothetical protein